MSVETKIKELLNRASSAEQLTEAVDGDQALVMQGSSEKASFDAMPTTATAGKVASQKTAKDTSKAASAGVTGDTTQPMQGSSAKPAVAEMDEDEVNIGSKSAAGISKDTTLPTSKGDAKSVKVPAMEETEVEEDNLKEQIASIFGEDLSEEFRSKATSIFEAAVIARVNNEMEKVVTKLEEQTASQLVEFKEALVEKVDSYLSYVVEQWMEENALAVESGLRTEIAEDFISGLKTLFKEHYIEVPEEKYNVLEELQGTAEDLKSKLNESIEKNVEISNELTQLKRAIVLEEQTKDLVATEGEKLRKLVEGVEFESEELYREKVAVIKENYFPKTQSKSPEQVLVEQSGTNAVFETNDSISKYVNAISRQIKAR